MFADLRLLFAKPLIVLAMLVCSAAARPDVYQGVYRALEQRGGVALVLVTLYPADVSKAHVPQEMLQVAKAQMNIEDQSVDKFIISRLYHQVRGQYVYDTIQKHHEASKELLRSVLPHVNIHSSIPISNSFLIKATTEDVDVLAQRDEIMEMHGNDSFKVNLPYGVMDRAMPRRAKGQLSVSKMTARRSMQWNISKIGADQVWDMGGRSRGEGITYAIADTGVQYQHQNIRNNYKGRSDDGTYDHNYSWFDGVRRQISTSPGSGKCGFSSPEPCDDQGHGTHVTSTAVGADGYGVAPGAKWIACRNMDRGIGSPETYLNCLNFFLAPHDLYGANPRPELRPHAIGNSYGCPDSEGCSKRALTAATEALRAAGIFMSVSAGNSGPQCSTIADPPAIEQSVISVGATDQSDSLAVFSSRGPAIVEGRVYSKPNISAPGVGIAAAYPADSFRQLSGTSMASPHVGGAAVLVSALCPYLERNVEAIQSLLEATAIKLLPIAGNLCGGDTPSSVPNNHYGAGRLDVAAAVRTCRKQCERFPSLC